MTKRITIVAMVLLMLMPRTAMAHPGLTRELIDAIRQVESGGNDNAVGDGGRAIGPYQIHEDYWKDAIEFEPSIGGRYEDCFKREYAEQIVRAYINRYAPRNATPEQIAKIHNGGPGALKAKPGTTYFENLRKYWRKVEHVLRGGR